jgi:hypothetical protein
MKGVLMHSIQAFDGTRVLLSEERRKHITLRHPELEDKIAKVLAAVANPDEVYVDPTGAVHVLKRLTREISDYLVVIYRKENRGFGSKSVASSDCPDEVVAGDF